MESVWLNKAPLADVSMCDGYPYVRVNTSKAYGDKGKNSFYFFKAKFSNC